MKIHARLVPTIAAALFAAAALPAAAAIAAVVISNDPTRNMSCSGGICTPTAADAVLNASDLFFMLEDSDVTIKSSDVAPDIELAVVFGWNMDRRLTLDAYRSIAIKKQLTIAGINGSLALATNDGGAEGEFWFDRTGHIDFWNRSARLIVNGTSYKLVQDISGLAAAVANKPGGSYALANDYNARRDGSYSHPPIGGEFAGTFEGLGHTISNLAIWDTDTQSTLVGMFEHIKKNGVIRDLRLRDAEVLSENTYFQVAGLLAGASNGTILQCSATGSVQSDYWINAGGLVGESDGTIARSFADVTVEGAVGAEAGGLAAVAHGKVSDSYALGHVIAGDHAEVGGLLGYSDARLKNVYSTGTVSGGQGALVGGLIGDFNAAGKASNAYWDTTTSGTTEAVGAGESAGMTGLTTEEFQSALPDGFSSAIWREKNPVNSGYPYLLPNPPPK